MNLEIIGTSVAIMHKSGGKKMNLKEYIIAKRKKKHEKIFLDICGEINNCADCYNEEHKCCICNATKELERNVFDISAKGFFMKPHEPKVNLKLCEVAGKNEYHFEIILKRKGIFLHFFKKRNGKEK